VDRGYRLARKGVISMSLKDSLTTEIKASFNSQWQVEVAQKVPAAEDLRLNANHAKDLETTTVLYADIDGSTNMVDERSWWFSAEIYKAYLRCAGALIRDEGGTITAYDGDRVMAVFTGDMKNTRAVRCAMKIHHAVVDVIQPLIRDRSDTNKDFILKHKIGIDTSQLRAARIGVRADNDIVWIGRAANHAAKLTAIPVEPSIWITKSVYDVINDEVKLHNGVNMWQRRAWTQMSGEEVYCTTYMYTFA
jgi:class 3 adenylate cyclase